jgi:hypothetical protein
MARMSCPARRRYPARIALSAWGSNSASFSTCRVNSVLADGELRSGDLSGDVLGDRPKKDGRLRVLLRLRTGGDGDDGDVDSELGDEGVSMSVRERCIRLGNARGPPGTDGALVICTGRGFGANVAGGCFVRRACEVDGLMAFVWLLMLSFLVLEFLPREAKNPPVTLVPATERGAACDNGDPITVEWRKLMPGCTPASAG